jgi:hypothetical protein
MRTVRLAYRDDDRTPVIFCIKEMGRRHYNVDVDVIHIKPVKEYEQALFNGACDVLIEHLEYLYPLAAQGKKITMFCAPCLGRGLHFVVRSDFSDIEEMRGKTIAVRASGRPDSIRLWLRMMGLERDVKMQIISDDEVGRWGQWKKVESGECIGTFMSELYLPTALEAGLKALRLPDLPVVAYYAQACLSRFAADNSDLLRDYLKSVIHAIGLMVLRKPEALEIVFGEPMRRMKITDRAEMERQYDGIVKDFQLKPFPTPVAIQNMYEIGVAEYGPADINPLTLWDIHWVKQLDDSGFIDDLISKLQRDDFPLLEKEGQGRF